MDWQELEEEIIRLVRKIHYSPDIIVGIVRGGIIPARLLSTHLKVKEMYCLTVKKLGNERKVMSDIIIDMSDKRVLLVEDILETGKSLIVAKKYLEGKGAQVKTACLYITPSSVTVPDYYLKKIDAPVLLPWE